MAKKIFGWVLLVAGVAIIIWTLFSSYNIFTGKTQLPDFFQIQASQSQTQEVSGVQAQVQNLVSDQLKKILPLDSLPQILNLAVWSGLAFILIFGGKQLSAIGTNLLRKDQ
jgi:hypothetical protein